MVVAFGIPGNFFRIISISCLTAIINTSDITNDCRFDRDLGVCGRVFVRSKSGAIQQKLVKIDRAILRVSNLAIHLQSAEERKGFSPNKEDHLSPILATAATRSLSQTEGSNDSAEEKEGKKNDEEGKEGTTKDGWTEYQEPLLISLLASELQLNITDIVDFELSLFDIQKAALGGVHSEFVHSGRLDNLASCFLAVQALVECVDNVELLAGDEDINMVVLYDHEEVGSSSAVGAAGPILGEAVDRISAALSKDGNVSADERDATIHRSFVLSSDQAHALHPNYASKHEKSHQPQMNGGMVIKRNANQRYATNGVTALIMREIARRASLPPVQEFIVRQDCGCGSTIGPLISTATGIRAIDMGCPQLSMHSIRETMGTCDCKTFLFVLFCLCRLFLIFLHIIVTSGLKLFKSFFQYFREVDESIDQ
mmetsp:Transcript_12312/g.29293  ORF Transcript_12312/g.29293 Transcript_12312/m.29293 type:complete len:426 (+) Transcript_12312:443-1720(+)